MNVQECVGRTGQESRTPAPEHSTCLVELGMDLWRFSSPTQLPKAALLPVSGHSTVKISFMFKPNFLNFNLCPLPLVFHWLFLPYFFPPHIYSLVRFPPEPSLLHILSYNFVTAKSYQEALHKVREGKSRHLRNTKRESEWRIP